MNVSAILVELGLPYISGYKPLHNYQQLLFEVVYQRVTGDRDLRELVQRDVTSPAVLPVVEDILGAWESPPSGSRKRNRYEVSSRVKERKTALRSAADYLAREAQNASLGTAGEEFVLQFERARLAEADRGDLAEQIEWTSRDLDAWAGFDIRSFETNGADRFIEVKTTAYGKDTPFYVSRNEVNTSRLLRGCYHLYRVFRFRTSPRLFGLKGAIDSSCLLDPITFAGTAR
jgi:hypothetical protein